MILILNLTKSVLIPLILGYSLILVLFRREKLSIPLKISLGFGLGLGSLSQWMLLLGIFKQPLSATTISLPLLLFSLLLIIYSFIRKKNSSKPSYTEMTEACRDRRWILTNPLKFLSSILILIFIMVNIYYVFWRALNIPICEWDAISTVAFKAKIFYYNK